MKAGHLRIVRRTLLGMKWGMVMAALLCLWVLILIPINGSLIFRSNSGSEYHAASIMLVYLLGGSLTGAVFGAMSPLLQTRIGAFCLGVLAMVPVGFGLLLADNQFGSWSKTQSIALVFMALSFGGPGGIIIREFAIRGDRQ